MSDDKRNIKVKGNKEDWSKMNWEPIALGDRVGDPITGFRGIVIAETKWLNGCVRYGVQPEEHKDGKLPDPMYFDQMQLRVLEKRVHQIMQLKPVVEDREEAKAKERTSGGPDRETAQGFRPF